MKNRDILVAFDGIISLLSNDIKLPGKVSYAIVRNIHILEPIVKDIESAKDKVIIDYGEPVPGEPNKYQDGPEGKLFSEIENLLNADTPISIQRIFIKDIEDVNLSVSDMDKLYFMIDKEED